MIIHGLKTREEPALEIFYYIYLKQWTLLQCNESLTSVTFRKSLHEKGI